MKRPVMTKHNYPGLYFQIMVFRGFKESKCNLILLFSKYQEKLLLNLESKKAGNWSFNLTDVKVVRNTSTDTMCP